VWEEGFKEGRILDGRALKPYGVGRRHNRIIFGCATTSPSPPT